MCFVILSSAGEQPPSYMHFLFSSSFRRSSLRFCRSSSKCVKVKETRKHSIATLITWYGVCPVWCSVVSLRFRRFHADVVEPVLWREMRRNSESESSAGDSRSIDVSTLVAACSWTIDDSFRCQAAVRALPSRSSPFWLRRLALGNVWWAGRRRNTHDHAQLGCTWKSLQPSEQRQKPLLVAYLYHHHQQHHYLHCGHRFDHK